VHPTIVAATGAPIAPAWKLDGVNLLPFVTGAASGRPHDTLFWRMGAKHAVRDGDWKLTVEPGTSPALFNLAQDIGEKTDLSAKDPVKMKDLVAKFDAWSASMSEAGWQHGPRKGKPGRNPSADDGRFVKRFSDMDKNHDGKLTADEVGRPKAFQQMDANHDGAVTFEEAKAFWAARQAK
jgi:hypothetical protein